MRPSSAIHAPTKPTHLTGFFGLVRIFVRKALMLSSPPRSSKLLCSFHTVRPGVCSTILRLRVHSSSRSISALGALPTMLMARTCSAANALTPSSVSTTFSLSGTLLSPDEFRMLSIVELMNSRFGNVSVVATKLWAS